MVSANIRTIRVFIGMIALALCGATSNLQADEIFTIDRGGQITAVEAMAASLPYGKQNGWGD